MKKQNEFLTLLAAFTIMVMALFVVVTLVGQKTNNSPKATSSYQTYVVNDQISEIRSTSDLDTQLKNLDSINTDQINTAINNNEADALSL